MTINHRNSLFRLAVIAVAIGASAGPVAAQTPPAAPKPAAPPPPPAPGAPVNGVPADVLPDVPAGEAGSGEGKAEETNISSPAPAPGGTEAPAAPAAAAPPPLVFPTAGPGVLKKKRVKPLTLGTGLDPTAPDFGGEADLVSIINEGAANVKPRRWTFVMHGYLRAPLRVGLGPANIAFDQHAQSTNSQLHSPPRIVGGFTNEEWTSVGLNPGPFGALHLSVGNAVVSGTMIISAGDFFDAGYRNLDEMGGISQGYVTMKFSDLFGSVGGLAVTAGAFSNRYGLAGPKSQSTGYYNTTLFGRTHVAGAAVTGDFDLTDRLELVVEGGGGAKLEVVPWLNASLSDAPYLPDQGPTPQGSNFVYHGHASLILDDLLRVSGHYLMSWSPNDLSTSTGGLNGDTPSSSLKVFGGDVHYDSPRFGSGYVGYSRLDGQRLVALADGVEVLHSPNGVALTRNYFNPLDLKTGMGFMYTPGGTHPAVVPGSVGDGGTVDTVLFQYILRLAPLLELPPTGRDVSLAVFGMFNHVKASALQGGKQDKFKVGGEVQFAAMRFLSAGVRFDRVMPNGGDADYAYSALSPRLILHTAWLSREYLLLSYSRFFYGTYVPYMGSQTQPKPDSDLFVLSALISF